MKNTDAENQFSPGRAAPFYLAAARAAEGLPQETATGKQHLAALRAAGVREEEIAWLGLNILEVRTGVTKDDVAALIKENAVMVIEEMLTGNDARWGAAGVANAYHYALQQIRTDENVYHSIKSSFNSVAPALHAALNSYGRQHDDFRELFSFDMVEEGGGGFEDGFTKWDIALNCSFEKGRAILIPAEEAKSLQKAGWRLRTPFDGNPEDTRSVTGMQHSGFRMTAEMYREDAFEEVDGHNTNNALTLPGGENYRELKIMLTGAGVPAETHWNTPDVIAHARMDERDLPDGRRILLIQEIQSDPHQKGAAGGYAEKDAETVGAVVEGYARWMFRLREDAGGFGGVLPDDAPDDFDPDDPDEIDRLISVVCDDGRRPEEIPPTRIACETCMRGHNDVPDFLTEAEAGELLEFKERYRASYEEHKTPPDIPFKKTWHEMMFRRLVREAAACGLDGVAWTGGAMQTGRREQAMAGRGQDGGQFLRTLYDKKLPQYAGDFGKAFGAACGSVQISGGGVNKFHHMPVTPPMREEALTMGFPLFSASMPDARGGPGGEAGPDSGARRWI